MIKKILIAAAVLVILAALSVSLLIYRNHSAGVTLELYKVKLRANGEKLTFTELAVPPSTDMEDVLSREIFATNAYPQSLPPQSLLMEYIAEGKARMAWRGKLRCYPPSVSQVNTPVFGDWKAFDQTNVVLAVSLDKFKEALWHPAPDTGWIYQDRWQNILNVPRDYKRDRFVAQALGNAEIGELRRGNLNAAFLDLHALAGLAQLNRNELTMVHQMVRVAVVRAGITATWEALQAPGWEDVRLKAIQQDWEGMNLLEAVERGFQGERALNQLTVDEFRRAKGQAFWHAFDFARVPKATRTNENFPRSLILGIVPIAYKLTSENEDESLLFGYGSREIEIVRLAKANHPWPEVSTAYSNAFWNMEEKIKADHIHRHILSALSAINFSNALQTAVRGETERRLAIIAIALKRHQLRHGKPPQSLTTLVPEFLHEVPIDPMSGKPICYRLNPDGTFVLYSAGEDGRDNGGKAGKGLWSGPDAVWPSAATSEEQDAAERILARN